MKVHELLQEKKNETRAEKEARRAAAKGAFDEFGKEVQARLAKEKADKLASYYDGKPMKLKLKVWTDSDPRTGKRRFEMREFTIDNTQHVRAQLSDVELQDMRYLENAAEREETYAIKTSNKHFTGSIPEYLFDLPKRTRKKKGTSPRDLRREVYNI
jgi:hypothetical protein